MADQIQSRLLKLAALFLILFSIILSLSPVIRERSWNVASLKWSHWLGLAVWGLAVWAADRQIRRRLPERDPYLFPIAAFFSGWGLLTIWRLSFAFGLRQTLWLVVGLGVLTLGLRWPHILPVLKRYKYLWLSGGLLLTALTLFFGTNPAGGDERLWLGAGGVYIQPSEPLKLLLVIYLASYLADRLPLQQQIFPLIFPTLLLTGLALVLLLVQRDLGTASIFILLYASVLYLATGRKRVILVSAGILLLAGAIGYTLIGVVHLRVDTWLNPWLDPSGHSYQIIQSLLAVASGGLLGRGPGLGSPGLVPIAHSDFIFSTIAEETGLVGTLTLLGLLALFLSRGMRAALHATNRFRRLLAAGLTTYLGIQSLLIIGGNLRLLPLTGVTLPFISYGGSSLVTSYIALFFLLLISNNTEQEPAHLLNPAPYQIVNFLLIASIAITALSNGWWAVIRGPDLLTRSDNPRRAIADRYVPRGAILDRNNRPINVTQGELGGYNRVYLYPDLGPIVGYTHPVYGQAGLEISLDPYLRGLQGNPASLIWWNHLVYGWPPPGLEVRLSLDLDLQKQADISLGDHSGAIVLLNASNGEILAMASHPVFNANQLDTEGPSLAKNERSPLLNRAAQGLYPPGNAIEPFLLAQFGTKTMGNEPILRQLYNTLGFYTTPDLRLPVAAVAVNSTPQELRVSPLQMALATAALSNHGIRPAPRIAQAVNTPRDGWVVLPTLTEPAKALPTLETDAAGQSLAVTGQAFWEWTGQSQANGKYFTWYLAGTLPNWQSTPLAIVVALEEDNLPLAIVIGRNVIKTALGP
jgi:cell division protein FtsW (lipid II flippase)